MKDGELYWDFCAEERMTREHPPEPLDFFIWTVEVILSPQFNPHPSSSLFFFLFDESRSHNHKHFIRLFVAEESCYQIQPIFDLYFDLKFLGLFDLISGMMTLLFALGLLLLDPVTWNWDMFCL